MLSHREAGSAQRGTVLLLHGYPESSYMWRDVLDPMAAAGWRAVAPDLVGFGDTPAAGPGGSTWEAQVAAVEAFRRELGLGDVVLVVHDWGGLIGLRWACDHPDAVRALVVSNTGFFPDGRWHGMAQMLRTPGEGEQFMDAVTPELLAIALRQLSSGMSDEAVAEYAKAFGDDARRAGILELYRSGDFAKLEAYDGRLAALDVPALVLWGADDPFAPIAGAHRLHDELPGSSLVVVDDAGHFVYADAPERCADELVSFLAALP